jgi:hypothetical protein
MQIDKKYVMKEGKDVLESVLLRLQKNLDCL